MRRQDIILHLLSEMASYLLEGDPQRLVVSLHQEDTGLHLCLIDSNEHSDEEIATLEKTMNSQKRPELAAYYGAMTGQSLLGKARLDLLGWQVKHVDVSKRERGIKIDIWLGGDEFQSEQFNIPKPDDS